VARDQGHEGAAQPAGGIQLVAAGTTVLILAGEKGVAGQRETRAEGRLERPVDAEALALQLVAEYRGVLHAVESVIGIAIAVDVHVAATEPCDLRRNRRRAEGAEKTARRSRAGSILAEELAAVLV